MIIKKSPKSFPEYKIHKSSNRAYVWHDGKRIYLGIAESPESYEAFRRLIAELAQNQKQCGLNLSACRHGVDADESLQMKQVMAAFLTAHEEILSKGEFSQCRLAFRELRQLYGHTPISEFGPRTLKIVREEMVKAGLSRRVINVRVGRIKRMIKWAVGEELVPPSLYHALQAVDGLRIGQTKAKEIAPVAPAAMEDVEALLPFLPPPLAAMVQIQLLGAMRPTEACLMKGKLIDRSGDIWIYRPESHKGLWRAKGRAIPLGPKAQVVLQPFLDRPDDEYLFSPMESTAWCREQRRIQNEGKRKTPKYPSEKRSEAKRKAKRHARKLKRQVGAHYNKCSYNRALKYAFERASKAGVAITPFFPYQLRHTRATQVRSIYGLEASQLVCGHERCDVTQVYAERDFLRLIEITRELG